MKVPTQDQVMGQLRTIIPAIGTIISALGVANSDKVGGTVAALLTAVGPISYLITAVWSFIANSRASIMAAAAKPVAPGIPAPQIVLPPQETALAGKLPSNVNTTADVKVVAK
jgi:hypothetical protein